jgi:DNA-binding NtrC family response regulator
VTTLKAMVQERRETAILGALQATNGNRRRAAVALGMSLRTLLSDLQKMRARGLTIPDRTGQ